MRSLLLSALLLLVAACAHRAGQDVGPTPLQRELKSGPAAAVTLTVPGTPQADWNTIVRALTDSSYRFADGDYLAGILIFRSLVKGRLLRMEIRPLSRDSVAIILTGRQYIGNVGRKGTVLASDAAWPEIRVDDTATTALKVAAERIRTAFTPSVSQQSSPPPPSGRLAPFLQMSPDSMLRNLGNGRMAFCKANSVRRDRMAIVDNVNLADWCHLSGYYAARMKNNTYILVDPLQVAPGRTLDVCAISEVPAGFEIIEWFTNRSHCPFDPSWIWQREPNMMRLIRVS